MNEQMKYSPPYYCIMSSIWCNNYIWLITLFQNKKHLKLKNSYRSFLFLKNNFAEEKAKIYWKLLQSKSTDKSQMLKKTEEKDYLNNVIEISKPSYYSQKTAKNEFLQGKL